MKLEEKQKVVIDHLQKAREIAQKICDIEMTGNYASIDIMVALLSMQTILEKDNPGMQESAMIILEGAAELRKMAEHEKIRRMHETRS